MHTLSRTLGWLAALGLLIAASAQGSDAQVGTDAFTGRWRLAMPADKAQARIDEAIQNGTEDMRALRRKIGRKRLHAKNRLIRRIEVGFPSDSVAIRLEGDHYVTPDDGRLVTVTLSDGEEVRVAQQLKNGKLVQRFVGSDGVRTDVFTLSPDGSRLTMSVVLTSDQLPGPIRYRIPYRR